MRRPLVTGIARAGYAARGIVYFLVGGLAVVAALGRSGADPDTKSALMSLLGSGGGRLILAAIGIGLICYAIWRLLQSVFDADDHGWDLKGAAVRGGLFVSMVTHLVLAGWAIRVAWAGGERGEGKNDLVAWLMQQPYGPWLVAVAGLCILGAGIAHIRKAITRGYEKWMDADEAHMKVIRPISSTGLIARGIVFLVIGGLVVYAGWTYDSDEAGGLADALRWIRSLPGGALLYLAMAVGLLCFGGYSCCEAIYRRIGMSG